MAGYGRATKLTPEVHKQVVGMVQSGCTIDTAAAAAMVAPNTLRDWRRWGKLGTEPYAKFEEDLTAAWALAEAHDIASIGKAGRGTAENPGDWRALAWRREKMQPRKYGTQVRVIVEQELENILDLLKAKLTPEEYERVLAVLAEADAELDKPGEAPVPGLLGPATGPDS